MLRRKYFDVSNRWYATALRVRKSQNGEQIFRRWKYSFPFPFVTCVRVRKSTKWFVESRGKSQPSPFQKVKAQTNASSLDNLVLSTELIM